ncbi:MAG: hypothetical protein WBL19_01460 [Minisyncoccia bacterium]
MFKILVLVLSTFFAIGAGAQSITHFPTTDDEDFLEDTMGETTAEVPGALCFHAESLSVSDRELVESYAKRSNLKFQGLCLDGEQEKGKYSPINVPESFLTIPGTYVKKGNPSANTTTWMLVGFIVILIVAIGFVSRRV